MNHSSHYGFCRTTPSKPANTTTFMKDETAIKFGFTIEDQNHGERFVLKRWDTSIEFDSLEMVQCWLKGYEFNVVKTSEYV